MVITRFQVGKEILYGEVKDGRVYVLEGDIFGSSEVTGKSYNLEEVRVLAPVEPGKVILVGLNYFAHIVEYHSKPQIPEEPVIWMAPSSAIIGPGEEIVLHYPEHENHYEAELVVVIGKEGRDIPVQDAASYILGYTCGNDVSDRVLQKQDRQWTRAKGFHTYKPLGPYIVTDLEPKNVRVRSRVNGESRQDGNTSVMIKDVYQLVSFISGVMTLQPGDVIYSGTPDGVGALMPGDVCEIEIEGIGILRNPVVSK